MQSNVSPNEASNRELIGKPVFIACVAG